MKTKKEKESDLKYFLDDLMASGNQDGAVQKITINDNGTCTAILTYQEYEGEPYFRAP